MSVGAVNKQTGDRIPTAGMPAIDNALSLSSTNPVQNAVISNALALKQDATDNSLQTTDKTIVGAVNELKNGLTNYENQNNTNLEVPNRKNLFDKDSADILTGKALNSETGSQYPSENWSVSPYIKIEPSTNYTLTTGQDDSSAVAFYDSEKTYISGFSTFGTRETPSNAKYLRFDYKTVDLSIMQLELGSTATAYTPYIPSVESRIEAVESKLTNISNVTVESIVFEPNTPKFIANIASISDIGIYTVSCEDTSVIGYVRTATTQYQAYGLNTTSNSITCNVTIKKFTPIAPT